MIEPQTVQDNLHNNCNTCILRQATEMQICTLYLRKGSSRSGNCPTNANVCRQCLFKFFPVQPPRRGSINSLRDAATR